MEGDATQDMLPAVPEEAVAHVHQHATHETPLVLLKAHWYLIPIVNKLESRLPCTICGRKLDNLLATC